MYSIVLRGNIRFSQMNSGHLYIIRFLVVIAEQNNLPVPEAILHCDTRYYCEGEKGLLMKTLDVLMSAPFNSTLRYASVCEVLQRITSALLKM